MKILGSEVLWSIFGTLVQDGLAQIRGVTWKAVPAKFNTGMCEMNIHGCEVYWCVFLTLVQDGLAQIRGVTWRSVTSISIFDMPTLKVLTFAMLTRHGYDVGAETGWAEKSVIEYFPRKCSFYSKVFKKITC